MGMPKSRWIHEVKLIDDAVFAVVSPWENRQVQSVVPMADLTRQELRRACANLGVASLREDSRQTLEGRIVLRLGAGRIAPPSEPVVVPEPIVAPSVPYSVTVQVPEGSHRDFATVVRRLVHAKVTPWLHGEAGTGKTTLAMQIADYLGIPFYGISVTAQMTAAQFFGYTDARGEVVRTSFRDAWENGGVFLLDEASSATPNLAAGINMALANGVCAFPDGMIQRNADCWILAAANDIGQGPTPKYPKGLKQDASFLDRFTFTELTLDESIVERGVRELVADSAVATTWLNVWRICRRNVQTYGLALVITPRSALDGAALLSVGETIAQAAMDCILKGASRDIAVKVLEGTGVAL
jgi:hypothetical protein